MNISNALQARRPDGRPKFSRDLRYGVSARMAPIGALTALMAVAVALAGCDAVEPAGASDAPVQAAGATPAKPERANEAASAAPHLLNVDPVTYTPEDWVTHPDQLPTF